ncbi:MAG: phosphotransferase, partial [Chloroflexi bacterium]|nr:phosphotransferase [Chloroflexota bacterium]
AWVGDREDPLPWALVIKVLRPHPIYPRRDWDLEALLYREGPFALLPAGVRAPRCYGVERRREDEWWLWLEAIKERPGLEWEWEEFTEAARRLGHFNGAYLAGYPLPEARWLQHDALRAYIRRYAPDVPRLWEGLEQRHPLIVRMCPPDVAIDLKHLWHRRKDLLNTLDGLPQIFCHNDAGARNLFLGQGGLVAVDWDFAGRGVPGQEIVPLCAELTNPGQFSTEQAPALREAIYAAYVEGLYE